MPLYQAPYKAEHVSSLPPKVRPIVRYRQEEFGFLAAFPDGHLGLYLPSAEPLLAAGSSHEECAAHKVVSLRVPTDFHFSAPLMAWIELTRLCNLRCPHCFVDAGDKREIEMSTDRIMHLLDELAGMGVFSVVITGGEPSLQPDFLKIVRRAHDLGFVVAIASNGMPLTPKVLSQIPHDDVIISISLDGIHGQGAATGEDDFVAATRRLLEIREQGFNTSFMTTTTHDNVGDLQKFVTFAVDNNVSLRSVPFVPMGRGRFHRELQNRVEDIDRAAQFWLTEEKWTRIKDQDFGLCSGKIFGFLFGLVYTLRRCMSGRGLCYVTSDGTVYPCSNCSASALFPGGNLLEKEFAEIWNDNSWPIRGVTWKSYLNDVCEGCPINDDKFFCTGRCPGSSFALNQEVVGCGVSEFQRQSIVRREQLFRQEIGELPTRRELDPRQVGTDRRIEGEALPAPKLVTLGSAHRA